MKEYYNILNKINVNKNEYQKLIKDLDNYIIIKDNFKSNINLIETSLYNDNIHDIMKTCHKMDDFYQEYKFAGDKIDNIIDDIYIKLNDTKKECNNNVNKTTNDTSFYQNEIKNLKNIYKITENLSKQIQNNLYEISIVSYMPIAYKQSIFEIARRQKFKKEYNNQISLMIKTITKIREDEIQKRSEFNNKYGCYLSSKYVNFNGIPSSFDIKFNNFDANLPVFEDNYDFVDEIINNIVCKVIEKIPDDESVIYSENEDEDVELVSYISYFNKIVKK